MLEWQDISTAPRTGEYVLLWLPSYQGAIVGHWDDYGTGDPYHEDARWNGDWNYLVRDYANMAGPTLWARITPPAQSSTIHP